MGIKVILADDHLIFREGLRLLIETKDDIEVIGDVSNEIEAIMESEKLSPDVVIMDIGMLKLNGIDASQEIINNNPQIDIIILSIHSSSLYIARALKAGVKGYLVKEAAGKELVEAIKTVKSGEYYLSRMISGSIIKDYVGRLNYDSDIDPLSLLSFREKQVLQMVMEGNGNAEIAKSLFLSAKTIETHRSKMMKKLGIKNLPELVKFAIRNGLTHVLD